MTKQRTLGIAAALCFLSWTACAQSDDMTNQVQVFQQAVQKQELVAVGVAVVMLLLLLGSLVVIVKVFRRSALGMAGQKTDQYRARHEQHMERVEASLERIAQALERKGGSS